MRATPAIRGTYQYKQGSHKFTDTTNSVLTFSGGASDTTSVQYIPSSGDETGTSASVNLDSSAGSSSSEDGGILDTISTHNRRGRSFHIYCKNFQSLKTELREDELWAELDCIQWDILLGQEKGPVMYRDIIFLDFLITAIPVDL